MVYNPDSESLKRNRSFCSCGREQFYIDFRYAKSWYSSGTIILVCCYCREPREIGVNSLTSRVQIEGQHLTEVRIDDFN